MKKLLLFAAAAAVLASCAPKTAPELPMETFFRNSEKTGYQISPDGRYFSYMAPYESRRNIFVQPVDGKDAVRITSETERDLAGYFWANNNRILYLKDTGGDENFQLYGVDIDGSNPKTSSTAKTYSASAKPTSIAAGTEVKAYASKTGALDSGIMTATA